MVLFVSNWADYVLILSRCFLEGETGLIHSEECQSEFKMPLFFNSRGSTEVRKSCGPTVRVRPPIEFNCYRVLRMILLYVHRGVNGGLQCHMRVTYTRAEKYVLLLYHYYDIKCFKNK